MRIATPIFSKSTGLAAALVKFESAGLTLSSCRIHRPPSAALAAFARGDVDEDDEIEAVMCATFLQENNDAVERCGVACRVLTDGAAEASADLSSAWACAASMRAEVKEAEAVVTFRRPSVYARERVEAGKSVPPFLLPAGAPGHLPPHVALARLEAKLAALSATDDIAKESDAGIDCTSSASGASAPAPDSNDLDVPPHVRAVHLLEELEARRERLGIEDATMRWARPSGGAAHAGRGAGQQGTAQCFGAAVRVLTAALAVAKFVFSTVATLGAIALIFWCIGSSKQALPPHQAWGPAIHIPLLIVVTTMLAYLEGIQVAILELKHVDGAKFAATRPCAARNHALLVARDGKNVERFLVGRQVRLFGARSPAARTHALSHTATLLHRRVLLLPRCDAAACSSASSSSSSSARSSPHSQR